MTQSVQKPQKAEPLTLAAVGRTVAKLRSAVGGTPLGPPWRKLRRALRRPTPAERKNAGYDKALVEVMERVLDAESNCIDVGAHWGAVLQHVVRVAPAGHHVAVEPLPEYAARLRASFPHVTVVEGALSAQSGTSSFAHVRSNEAYSGLRRRPYDRPDEDVVEITVEVQTLDDVAREVRPVRLVKIDVEGGELDVLRGGTRVLAEDRPFVAFEFGNRASAAYGASADAVYNELARAGLKVTTLSRWLRAEPDLDHDGFKQQTRRDFFFLAHP